ncbi:GIY-YIG nuclease family protein [Flavobacterium sp. NST-5]|uniref:GIY-YIG nuclease family protein n=1 Tax=Flavobacterium ichthyis TaxID=2698827 RepID=A0ABW9Z6U4_9FLAO|nr:GIY-YIG nuclease family protein [Flavobacterium ichthyis]NBL64596.1 GIY-YIG nuclease family protein [Flavobacterium ichthyis]
MPHYFYILFSEKANKYYIGETHNVEERVKKHNEHFYKNSYSKISNDWKLTLTFECVNRNEAIFLENFFKRMKSKKFIEKVIQNPLIIPDLLTKK